MADGVTWRESRMLEGKSSVLSLVAAGRLNPERLYCGIRKPL